MFREASSVDICLVYFCGTFLEIPGRHQRRRRETLWSTTSLEVCAFIWTHTARFYVRLFIDTCVLVCFENWILLLYGYWYWIRKSTVILGKIYITLAVSYFWTYFWNTSFLFNYLYIFISCIFHMTFSWSCIDYSLQVWFVYTKLLTAQFTGQNTRNSKSCQQLCVAIVS